MILNTAARRFVHFAVLAATAGLLGALPAAAQEEPQRRTVNVSGEGTVRIEPDMAIVHFGVVTVGDDPVTARTQNAEASSRTLNAVRELGIEERYIRMETLRLQPHREWVEEGRRYEEQGYEATRIVVVEIHDLEMLPVLVAEVVEQGANRLEGVAYDLQDREQARNDALREAILHAQEKARVLAVALGEELGAVHSVHEQSFDVPRPMYRAEAFQMDASGAAPEPDAYAAGELEVRVQVQASFELE